MSVKIVCVHFQFGFCKYGERCSKKHEATRCDDQQCDERNCSKRHPRECKYFRAYKRCKFGEDCFYDHIDQNDTVLEELKLIRAKLEIVEKEIEERNLDIKRSLQILQNSINLLNNLNPSTTKTTTAHSTSSTPVTTSTRMSIFTATTVNSNPASKCKEQLCSPIPQVDGGTTSFYLS